MMMTMTIIWNVRSLERMISDNRGFSEPPKTNLSIGNKIVEN